MLTNGFKHIDKFISESQIKVLLAELTKLPLSKKQGGIRHVDKKSAVIAEFSQSPLMLKTAELYLEGKASLVRAIFFNKTPEQNWAVSWHQDRTVAVSKPFEQEGWHSWTVKDGEIHPQPPLAVLENMLTIRIHLDEATEENGCLKVIENSQLQGIMSQTEINEFVANSDVSLCLANRGAALIMRPHLLHSSNKAINPSQRRILHLEYSAYSSLPEGISWAGEESNKED